MAHDTPRPKTFSAADAGGFTHRLLHKNPHVLKIERNLVWLEEVMADHAGKVG